MISLIGTLKKVTTKSKVDTDGRAVHNIEIGLEITDDADRVQEIVESLKEIVSLKIENKQPKLPAGATKTYPDK